MIGAASATHEVEALFQTKSIAEVREVETKTRHEIEEKKQQLRQVVGSSYRDLISSADTILDINCSCHHLVELVGEIQGGLGGLAGSIMEWQHSVPDERANTSYDKLFALGSRVKYLIDTPETIWGCLDSRDFLEAARRFVRSAEVHRALGGHSHKTLHRFPLLQHQWPVVKKFKSQIWDRSMDWLGSQGELSSEQLASALLALALLKPMDGAELLKVYLSCRQTYITQCLEAALAGGGGVNSGAPAGAAASGGSEPGDLDTLTVILGDVLALVCRVVAQAGQLFLQLPGVTAVPLLGKVLQQDDLGLADLAFDTHPGPKSEVEAWKAAQDAVKERLSGLTGEAVASQCSTWLEQLSAQFRALGGRLLGGCGSGRDLLAVESGVKAALEAWQFVVVGDSPTPDATAPGATAAGEAAPQQAQQVLSWADASQWVLGRPLGLWPLLLEQGLVERAKELVAMDFTTVVSEVTGALGRALEEADSLPPAVPGGYMEGSWSELIVLQPGTPPGPGSTTAPGQRRRGSRRRGSKGRGAGAGGGEGGEAQAGAGGQGWLLQTEQALQVFDQQLSSALSAALDACYGPAAGEAASAGRPSALALPGLPAAGAAAQRKGTGAQGYAPGRAVVLEPFVQDRCLEAAQAIAAMLDARLRDLPSPPDSAIPEAAAAYAPTAQKALIVGRVALAVAGRSTALRVILGPPEQWQQAARGGGSSGAGPGAGDLTRRLSASAGRLGAAATAAAAAAAAAGALAGQASSPKLEGVQQQFRSLGLHAYALWAGWASRALASELASALAADQALVADAPLRGWEEIVVTPGAEGTEELLAAVGGEAGDLAGGAGPGEMRFWLPAAPSAAAMATALGACREADHAGGHRIDDESLALLKWELSGAVLRALSEALAPGGALASKALSEKGVLQLLLDLRFLHDLLSGGGAPPSGTSSAEGPAAAAGVVAARRRELARLEEGLQSQVDPIDWATYESYLYANKDRFAARCQVLFGLLLRAGAGAGPDAPRRGAPTLTAAAAGAAAADSNLLRMAAGVPRFSYLPVNTPALLRQSSQSVLAHSASGASLATAPSLGLGSPDKYTHALFGAGPGPARGGAGSGAEARPPRPGSGGGTAAVPGGGAGTGVGATALEALRHSRFGSLLGDKAAEVTARAQQTLGEYSFSNLSGALGGGAGGLLSAFKGERGGAGGK